jgi:CheY-like chemotaxis protein
VADDDPAVRESLCRGLRRYFEVEEVGDGVDVVARVEAGKTFAAIIMDLEMPLLDGRRTLERLAAIAP